MSPPEPALFRAFPSLAARLPRHACLAGPTALERLPLQGFPPDALWVKRDDRSGARIGGNKPRKLEFLLGAAMAHGARRVVTTGGLGSNHGLATCVLAREAGIATTLVLVHQPVTPAVQRALLLDAAWGAELVWGAHVPGAVLQVVRVLARSAARGERPWLIATGGSSRRGSLGFVSAAFELAQQLREDRAPEPAEIYVPVGSGGTLVGLIAGLPLAGLRSRVVGVLVTDIFPPSHAGLTFRARRALAWLARMEPRIAARKTGLAPFELCVAQRGPGYGATTPAAEQAVRAAAEAGLHLETTYTGKCMAELRERARRRELPHAPVLFWNTFNSVDVEATAPQPLDPRLLPPRFRRFFPQQGRDERDA